MDVLKELLFFSKCHIYMEANFCHILNFVLDHVGWLYCNLWNFWHLIII